MVVIQDVWNGLNWMGHRTTKHIRHSWRLRNDAFKCLFVLGSGSDPSRPTPFLLASYRTWPLQVDQDAECGPVHGSSCHLLHIGLCSPRAARSLWCSISPAADCGVTLLLGGSREFGASLVSGIITVECMNGVTDQSPLDPSVVGHWWSLPFLTYACGHQYVDTVLGNKRQKIPTRHQKNALNLCESHQNQQT